MARAILPDRGIVEISGPDAANFLHNLVTNSVMNIPRDTAVFIALLTPQGKILVDGFLSHKADTFLLDCPQAGVADLIKRLSLYRLRAHVTFKDCSADCELVAGWNEPCPPVDFALSRYDDPRLNDLGWRMIIPNQHVTDLEISHSADAYHAHRIALGIPEGGRDFAYGDLFPHEADMDQLNGIDFKKGCYVGQEVVSRMQHRGLARTRAVPVRFDEGVAPPEGTAAEAAEKVIGMIGSHTTNGLAIAILRLDRVETAISAGDPLRASGLTFSLESRPWIGFSVPRSI